MFLLLSFCLFISTSHAFVVVLPSFTQTPSLLTTTSTATTLYHNKRKANKKTKQNRSKPKGFAGALRDLQLASFSYAGTVKPGQQSPQKVVVEEGILQPDYAKDGTVCCFIYIYIYICMCV